MNNKVFSIIQWTWGSIQSTAGAVYYIKYLDRPHFDFNGACVTVWPKDSSMSLGKFIFLTDSPFAYHPEFRCKYTRNEMSERILVHEYGHCVQPLILGPLYLVVIGIPSLTWGTLPVLRDLRQKKKLSYFDLFCEKNANTLGERVTKRTSIGRVM